MPGPYDRKFDADSPYTYTTDLESPYTYTDSKSSGLPSKAPDSIPKQSYGSPAVYSDVPSSPSGSYSSPSKATASGPSDDAIDSMLAANGGKITSRMMRQLERQAMGGSSSSKLPQWPPAPPAPEKELSPTEQKRQKIMSRVKKTKTTDSEGGDLSFAGKDDGPLAGKQLVDHYKGEEKGVAWRTDLEGWATHRNRDPNDPATRKDWEKFRDSDKVTTRYDTDGLSREKSRLKE